MHPLVPMLDTKARIFFSIFFIFIVLSIGLTYFTIEVKHDYMAFTEEDEIPEPTDAYRDLYSWGMQLINPAAE